MLLLYTKTGCPFCVRVKEFATENDISYEEKNVYEEEEFMGELLEKGGKRQIPFLHDTDTGTMMYESLDIIEYLKDK